MKTKKRKPKRSEKKVATKKKKIRKRNISKVSKESVKKKTKKISKKETNSKVLKKPILKKSSKKQGKDELGISGFDKMTNGGFEKKSMNLIAGGSGSGKTMFALQFLIEGVKKGEQVLYITFEEDKKEFYENMKTSGWDLEKLEKSGKFIFLEYSPEKVKMMLDEGGGTIESTVLKHQIKRLVIDSITSFSLLFEDDLSKRQANLGLFDIIKKWNCTTLLTVQDDPLNKKNRGISSIEFEVDSITLLYFVHIKNKRERFMEVLKMRGTNHSKDIYSFDIKNGIKIGKKISKKKSLFRDSKI